MLPNTNLLLALIQLCTRVFQSPTTLFTLAVIWMLYVPMTANAAITGLLSETRALGNQKFEADLAFQGDASEIGNTIELFNLDIFDTRVNDTPISVFGIVEFSAFGNFESWQDTQQFGATPGFESQITLDAFASPTSVPFELLSSDSFIVGTLRFDYSGLGLQDGDTITLDIRGRDDGNTSRTTSIAVRPQGSATTSLIDPAFTAGPLPGRTVFEISSIPEPSFSFALLLGAAVVTARRRR